MDILKSKAWLRRTVWSVLAVLVLWALGWLALPPLLRSQGQKLASEALGRDVRIGRIEFVPWSLQLTVHDVAVATADGQGAQFTVTRVLADVGMASLLRLAPVLDALEVDQPVLRLAQLSPGHYDIDDILARLAPPGEPDPAPAGPPPRFALYNIAVRGGAVDFEDRTVGRTHTVRDLALSVPFLSSLPSKREIKVEPRLAFKLNDSAFDSTAEATPFLSSRKTQAHVRLVDFDLTPYLGYLPQSLPVRLQSGVLGVDLTLSFEQQTDAAVHVRGHVRAQGLRLSDSHQQPLLDVGSIAVQIADLQPLAQRGHIASVDIEEPRVLARRAQDGQINWQRLASSPGVAPQPAAKPAPKGQADAGWQLAVDRVALRSGQVDWQDDAVAGGARLALEALRLDASAIAVPLQKPLQFAGSAQLQGAALDFQGEAGQKLATVAASVRGLPLEAAAPYVAEQWNPRVSGRLDADLGLAWNGPAVIAHLARLSVDDIALACPAKVVCAGAGLSGVAMRNKDSLAEVKALRVENARLDLLHQSLNVERIAITQPRALVARSKDGQWMVQQWMVTHHAPAPAVEPGATPARAAPWSVQLGTIDLDGGSLALQDALPVRPVAFNVSGLRIRLENLAPLAPPGSKPAQLQLAARVGAGRVDPGRLEYDGTLGLAPVSAQGQVLATQLPLHAFEPYVADALNVRVVRADGSFKGSVHYAEQPQGAVARVQGDAALDDLRVRSVLLTQGKDAVQDDGQPLRLTAQDNDLLRWKSLGLRGVDVALAPGQATRVEVRETALSDFFARMIVQENGRINLQDLVKAAPKQGSTAVAPQPQASAPVSTTVAAPAAVVRFGPVSLTGGAVRFSDYFIKPNYSADLSELTGRLSAFSSEPPAQGAVPAMADLELRGRAEGTASLEITGKLNPLAHPLALDIVGKMRDLELPPLSPYTVKYAGHGIERGKLSMDVAYKIEPNGQLTASNKLVLNQLTFGEPVEGAPASLPVRLATALLADRNGVIDLDLPISGSLNDPEFRLAPVIFKIIGNLIMKAVTSPFALLANALGGSSDLSAVAFAPGSAQLDEAARAGLDRVAKALTDRPALTMTVVGQAQLEREREGWKQAQLQGMLLAQKRRAARRDGQDPGDVAPVAPEEVPALLKEVYRRADIPKPRNFIGLAKDLPQSEMEALLLASIPVPENAMRELAVARGVAVRDYLAQHQVPKDRLFLGAVDTKPDDAKWTPRAQLTLAMP